MKPPSLVLILSLLILSAVLQPSVSPVRAVSQSGPTTWSPFGPRTRNLVMTVYGDPTTMFDAFRNGEVDITDYPVFQSDESIFASNPDFFLTEPVEQLGIFQLDVNNHNTFLGIPFQENRGMDSFNSSSTKQPTLAGIEIRRAIAHLLDKPSFINGAQLGGRAKYVDIQSPPGQGLDLGSGPSLLPSSVLAEDCAAHSWFTPCDETRPPISAYNLVSDDLADPFSSFPNRGWSGTADLRAACDHLLQAGFATFPSSASCADVATANGGAHLVASGQVDFYIRTHLPRMAFGQIIKDAIDFLFGTPCTARYGTNCFETYFTITEVADVVFKTDIEDDWHLYTGGWFLGSFPDHLYALYQSQLASNACGGKRSSFAQNYHFYCSPAFDQEATLGQFASTFAESSARFTSAAVIAHREVMTVPVYSGAVAKFAALNGWNFQPGTQSSLVPQFGQGFQTGFWSLMNMRQRPGYVPADPIFRPGGGDPDLIRRSLSFDISHLSPFHANTYVEFEVLGQIYDTLLKVNPRSGGVGLQVIDWMTVRHTSNFNASEVFAGVTGITTQKWTLREDLRWHDGVSVRAEDVAFSIIKFSDLCLGLLPCPDIVLDATALNSRTVQVKLRGQSPFYELNIGGLPMIPKHVWEPLGPLMSDPGFDPMANGKMVGSGPWVCKNLATGVPGGPCTTTGTQTVALNGQVMFTAYDGYHRGPGVANSFLQKFSWADRNNDGSIDILDIADAAFHFGAPDAYWNSGQNPLAPNVGTDAARVDIGELATVAFYFDQSLTEPYSPSQVIGLDPDIDPFF